MIQMNTCGIFIIPPMKACLWFRKFMLNFYAIQPVDINHKSKHCKANFYGSKVEELRKSDPRSWWKKVLRLSGAKSSCSSHLLAQIHVDELENVSTQKVADAINSTLLEHLEEYWLLNAIDKACR